MAIKEVVPVARQSANAFVSNEDDDDEYEGIPVIYFSFFFLDTFDRTGLPSIGEEHDQLAICFHKSSIRNEMIVYGMIFSHRGQRVHSIHVTAEIVSLAVGCWSHRKANG